uniref:Uncharacterized protein n=1 Tax=Kalanchoe fedtschenkoi TaxID=63787 RepID=A0A7N0T2P5_KALFE
MTITPKKNNSRLRDGVSQDDDFILVRIHRASEPWCIYKSTEGPMEEVPLNKCAFVQVCLRKLRFRDSDLAEPGFHFWSGSTYIATSRLGFKDALTDHTGTHKIPVNGENKNQICDVVLLHSPRSDGTLNVSRADRARAILSTTTALRRTPEILTHWLSSGKHL